MAASKLVKGDKLIAKRSLSGNRLRNHTITGKQVALKKLGTVPSATHATTASSATSADSASTATNATHASDAGTLDGQPPSAFVPTSHFISSNGLIRLTGTPAGKTQTIISSGPFTVTLKCKKTGSNVTESLAASSSEPRSDIRGTLEPAGTENVVELIGPSATFSDDENTNIDMAAPSGASLDFVEQLGINSLGSDCWIHFFGYH